MFLGMAMASIGQKKGSFLSRRRYPPPLRLMVLNTEQHLGGYSGGVKSSLLLAWFFIQVAGGESFAAIKDNELVEEA